MTRTVRSDPRSRLPAVDQVLQAEPVRRFSSQWGRTVVVDCLRELLADLRAQRLENGPPSLEALIDLLGGRLGAHPGRGPRPVFNLTGTIIHTNLGRAPLPRCALDAMQAASGSTDLELDLDGGGRGDRDRHVERLLCALTGAEAATVVNNNAAAVLLTLNTFAEGRQVPVSRGELVEIGGSFRMPDIMRRAGATLVEVGTTNRTRADDYRRAIGPETGMLMKVHPSNYEIRGFQEEATIAELAALAREHSLPLAWDLGSGSLVDLSAFGLPREPMPADALEAGADVVTFSGDKLLGGPQAGLIVGRARAIDAIRRNPLKRALRVDKLTLAALAAVLRLYGDHEALADELPVLRLIRRSRDAIRQQAERVRTEVATLLGSPWRVDAVDLDSQIGSGALPVANLPSAGLAIAPATGSGHGRRLERLHRRMRNLPVPVVGRIRHDRLLLDLRCLDDEAGFIRQLRDLEPQ